MSSHFEKHDYRSRGHRSYKRRNAGGQIQNIKARKGVGTGQKVGAGVVGGLFAPAGSYKGFKHGFMDAGASRELATAGSIGTLAITAPLGGPLAGAAMQAGYSGKEGVLNASRYTNKPSTQDKKRKGKRLVPKINNHLIGERKK